MQMQRMILSYPTPIPPNPIQQAKNETVRIRVEVNLIRDNANNRRNAV